MDDKQIGNGLAAIGMAPGHSLGRPHGPQEPSEHLVREIERLRSVNDQLDQFNHEVAHGLREPMRSAEWRTRTLLDEEVDHLSVPAMEHLMRVWENLRGMKSILAGLLDGAWSAGPLDGESDVDVQGLVAELARLLEAPLREFNGNLVLVGPAPVVRTSRVVLLQVLANLAGNGLKFNQSARPEVRIQVLPIEGGFHVLVDDNGIGIPQEHRDHLFRMFCRLPGREQYPGNGFGLAIAARAVRKLGGTIALEDGPRGVGTRFKLYFPTPLERGQGQRDGGRAPEHRGVVCQPVWDDAAPSSAPMAARTAFA